MTATCGVCRDVRAVNLDGTMRRHRSDGTKTGPVCVGSGAQVGPAPAAATRRAAVRTLPRPVGGLLPRSSVRCGVGIGWAY